MVPSQATPRIVPALVSIWAAFLFLFLLLRVDFTRNQGEAAPVGALFTGAIYLGGLIAVTLVAQGAARLGQIPVIIILTLLVGCPAFIAAEAYRNPHSFFSSLCAVAIPISGLSVWYFLRPSVRIHWLRADTPPAA